MLVFVLLPLFLAGCGTIRDALPAGVGTGRDDLKRSPCACLELAPVDAPPAWREDISRQLRRSLAPALLALPVHA